jgi:hypothetical protein
MLTEMAGDEENSRNAIAFLQQQNVKVEVLGYV